MTVDGIDFCGKLFYNFMTAGTKIAVGDKIHQSFHYRISEYETDAFSVFVSTEEDPMYTTDTGCRLLAKEYYRNIVQKVNTVKHNFVAEYVFGETELKIILKFETGELHEMKCDLN